MRDLLSHKLHSTILCLTLWALYLTSTNAGTLTPTGENPIDASVANRNEIADYTFYFIPDTTIPVGGSLTVTFPTQFTFGLGITLDPTCSVTCTISAFSVIFFFSEPVLHGVASSVTVKSVANPLTMGGTGNFKLISKIGNNILDQNLVFGVIGIADTIGLLTSTSVNLDSAGVLNAGEVSRYAFSFKVSQTIPAQSYMKFYVLDPNFGLSKFPSCSAFSINGKIIQGKLTCETVGREIYIRGLSADIPTAQDVGISVSMTNPPFSGVTETFTIALFRNGTNAIYDRRTLSTGIPITAGQISNVALTRVDMNAIRSRNKMMDYTLTFLPKNSLKLGSVIILTFPTTFRVDTSVSQNNYLITGLEDISEDSTVGMDIDATATRITLTNFAAMTTPQLISLRLRLINPDIFGVTSPIYIRTYTNNQLTTLIDEDIVNAITTIQFLPSSTSHSITTNTVATNLALASIEFNVVPSVTIAGSNIIKIKVPEGFIVDTVKTSSCFIRSINTGNVYVGVAACSNVDNLITLTFPTTGSFPSGASSSRFRLDNVITTPLYNGTYLFDITSYQSDGVTVIESWTDYMIVTSVPFPQYSGSSLCIGIGKTTILTFQFTTGLEVPAGIQQTKASDTKGFIELVFDSNIPIANLGGVSTSKILIPCKANAGLSPISGNIKCYLLPTTAPAPAPSRIQIENFEAIPASTVVSISFPKITNPAVNFQVLIKTLKLNNRIRTELNSASVTIAVATPGPLSESGPVGINSYSLTSNKVSAFTNITFLSGTSTTITGPGSFIFEFPFFDIGWIPSSNTIGCKLENTYYPCTRYDGADWIVIHFPAGASFPANRFITLENVRIPRYIPSLVVGILLRYIRGATSHESVHRPEPYLYPATPTILEVPKFYMSMLIANKKSEGAVNAKYTMMFTCYNEIPEGASILITFPPEYNILASYPPVQFSSPDLVAISSTQPVAFTPNVQTLTITGFKYHPAKTGFTINIEGLRNPTNDVVSDGWRAEILFNGGIMVLETNFDQFSFTPVLNPGTITFNSIKAFPLNAGEIADYTISFVPATEIPVGGQIRIDFPSDYTSLPNPPECSVTDGITTFASCILSGNTYIIELDSKYSTNGISVTIKNIPNPAVGSTGGFVVYTFYDGTYLDNTLTSDLTGRTVTIVPAASALAVQDLSCNPRNEGEPSTYTFVFLPTNVVSSSMQILITFPDVYDSRLGDDIDCDSPTGLNGDVGCTVANRVVTIKGFDPYTPDADNPITIKIYGVKNPNQDINSNTGHFKIATYFTNTEIFVDSNSEAGTFEPLPAPNWSKLFNVSSTNFYARIKADYTFNFTSSIGIPSTSSQGAILVDFPSDFKLTTQTHTCESKTTAFAATLSCSVERNRVTVNGHASAFTGDVIFQVNKITNPVESGTAGNIVLKIYDGFNALITERSYKNLDPFSFAYTFPGPQISANNNQTIRVERGTQTKDLYLTLDYPCALNLTIRPTTPGFSVIPSSIPFLLGMIKAKFRVSVSEDFPEGTYDIEWETLNDLDPPFYTPIKNTKVIVTSLSNLRINVPSLYEIPYGGNSLPTNFLVDYGPDIGFEILMNLQEEYPGIQLDRRNAIFMSGEQQSTFSVYSSNDTNVTGGVRVNRGTIDLALSGTNKDVYTLSQNTLDFQIISADPTPPEITELSITDITMNSANIVLGTSEIVRAYYMIALAGTAMPTMEEIMNKGPPAYQTTQSRYGTVQIGTENIVVIPVTDLVAETPYQVYVYVIDRGGNTNAPRSQTFTTLNRYNAADFSLRFKQSFLNSAERANIINSIAFVLSLPTHKVQERKYIISVSSSTSRLLEDETSPTSTDIEPVKEAEDRSLSGGLSIIYLQIMAIPESSVYPSPVNLALLLNQRNDMVSSRLTNYDSSYQIAATAFTRYTPAFPTTPSCTSYDSEWAVIQGSLNNFGWMFTLFVKASEDFGKPSPYQIANGLNNLNIKNPSGSVEISEAYKSFTVNVTGLDPLTEYNVYIIGGSAHPGYADLFNSDNIIILPVKTAPAKTTPRLNINSGSIVEISRVMLALLVIIGIFW